MHFPGASRDSGNDFRFPDIASYTCRFLIFSISASKKKKKQVWVVIEPGPPE